MNKSTNKLSHIIFIFITLVSLTIMISCSSEEEIVVPKEENEQTVIMFFPWSSNLLPWQGSECTSIPRIHNSAPEGDAHGQSACAVPCQG